MTVRGRGAAAVVAAAAAAAAAADGCPPLPPRHRYNALSPLLLVFVVVAAGSNLCHSFKLHRIHRSAVLSRRRRSSSFPFCCRFGVGVGVLGVQRVPFGRQRLWAKPPPTSLFDLEAIEALEQRLLMMQQERSEQEQMQPPEHSEGTEDGWDDEEEEGLDDDDEYDDEYESLDGVHGTGGNAAVDTAVVVPPHLNGARLDSVLATLHPHLSRSFCGVLILEGRVSLGDSNETAGGAATIVRQRSFRVRAGEALTVRFRSPDEGPTSVAPQDLPLDVLFEDDHIIVLNKAAHMVVHPGAGNTNGTIVNALAHRFRSNSNNNTSSGPTTLWEDEVSTHNGTVLQPSSLRPGIVHRLDKGTTGVIVVAKTAAALASLSEQFASRQVRKTYFAIAVGNPGAKVTVDAPIGRDPMDRKKMRVVPEVHWRRRRRKDGGPGAGSSTDASRYTVQPSRTGRSAVSHVETLAFDGKLSFVKVRIETGRTHQIRVHLRHRNAPVYGDDAYGLPDWNRKLCKRDGILQGRPLLHAYRLELRHPATGKRLCFRAPLPDDFTRVLSRIFPQDGRERPDFFIFPPEGGDEDPGCVGTAEVAADDGPAAL